MSKTEIFLKDMKEQLDEIHDILFSGKVTLEDLEEIDEDLSFSYGVLKEIKKMDDSINKVILRILKLLRAFFIISSSLMLCLLILGVLNIIWGLGLSYLLFTVNKVIKEYMNENIDSDISNELEKFLDDIIYKQDITKKKKEMLKRKKEIQMSTLCQVSNTVTEEITLKTNQTRILKLKK